MFSGGALSSQQRWLLGALAKQEPKQMLSFRQAIHPRDYHVFAGAVERNRLSFVGRLFFMVLKGRYGDYRNWQEIDARARSIACQLATGQPAPAGTAAGWLVAAG